MDPALRLNYDSLGEIYGPVVLQLNYDYDSLGEIWGSARVWESAFSRLLTLTGCRV